jgi:hypothetical protein
VVGNGAGGESNVARLLRTHQYDVDVFERSHNQRPNNARPSRVSRPGDGGLGASSSNMAST